MSRKLSRRQLRGLINEEISRSLSEVAMVVPPAVVALFAELGLAIVIYQEIQKKGGQAGEAMAAGIAELAEQWDTASKYTKGLYKSAAQSAIDVAQKHLDSL